jgi:hypothetical protein
MIVKNLLAVGVIATTATVASAADEAMANWKVGGKIRMDAVQSTTEVKAGDADKTTSKSSELVLNRAQFTLTGDKGGDKMFFKIYAHKTGSDMLDTATITHRFADNITVDFGKMGVLAQSWENDYSSTDQYLMSWAGTMAPSNANAVQLNANFGDHNVSVQAAQGIKSVDSTDATGAVTTTTLNNGGGLTAGLQYKGEINKMIRPIVTYTSVKTSGTKPSTGGDYTYGNGYQTQLGLGVQVETAGLVADLEYDSVKTHKMKWVGTGTEPTATAKKDSDTTSIVVQAKYAIGMTTPFLKITSNATKNGADEGVSDKTGMGLLLGVEHMLDTHCRLHAAYMSDASSTKLAASKTSKSTMTGFNLGVTASM